MLASPNRLTSHEDFVRVTKSAIRAHTKSLTGYLLKEKTIQEQPPKIGFIVTRALGGAVSRHSIVRKLRHASRENLKLLPNDSLVVVRATKKEQNAEVEIPDLFSSLVKKAASR